MKTQLEQVVDWALRVLAAAILLQTLWFKFSGAEESVYIFSQLGMEPWGRYGAGVLELAAGMMLLMRRWCGTGAILSLVVITGAVAAHLFRIGIVVLDDGGLLFGYALTVFLCSIIIAWWHRSEIPLIGKYFTVPGSAGN